MPPEQKKVYQKPVLERVVLVPQENVLAVCHSVTGSNEYLNSSCQTVNPCFGPSISVTVP